MESYAVPAVFLQNCCAVVVALIFSPLLRIRWLVAIIAWGTTIGTSYLWRNIGNDWLSAWKVYFYNPILDGGLWNGPIKDFEVIGVLVFWLLPLALAYLTTLTLIAKRTD